MLAPVSETTFTEQALLALNLASLGRYDRLRRRASSRPAACRPGCAHPDPVGRLRRRRRRPAARLRRVPRPDRPPCERLTSRECQGVRAAARPRQCAVGLLVEDDWSCDNRLLWAALSEAGGRAGVRERPGFVHGVGERPRRVTGVELGRRTPDLDRRHVVVANGAWAGQLTGIAAAAGPPGQGPDPAPRPRPAARPAADRPGVQPRAPRSIWCPREPGREVVVGATVEELGFDARATAGGVYELLRDARTVLPMTAEYALAETGVGWRPGHAGQRADARPLRAGRAGAGHRALPQRRAADPGHRRR